MPLLYYWRRCRLPPDWKHFSARATAGSFDGEVVGRGCWLLLPMAGEKEVYAAVNTLVTQAELPQLLNSLDVCSRCQIDAVILQDLGVARVIRGEEYPELGLRRSTKWRFIINRERWRC